MAERGEAAVAAVAAAGEAAVPPLQNLLQSLTRDRVQYDTAYSSSFDDPFRRVFHQRWTASSSDVPIIATSPLALRRLSVQQAAAQWVENERNYGTGDAREMDGVLSLLLSASASRAMFDETALTLARLSLTRTVFNRIAEERTSSALGTTPGSLKHNRDVQEQVHLHRGIETIREPLARALSAIPGATPIPVRTAMPPGDCSGGADASGD